MQSPSPSPPEHLGRKRPSFSCKYHPGRDIIMYKDGSIYCYGCHSNEASKVAGNAIHYWDPITKDFLTKDLPLKQLSELYDEAFDTVWKEKEIEHIWLS